MKTILKPVHSTGGFWLVIGALLLAASLRLLFWFAVACAVHELGHGAAIRLLGGRVQSLRLTAVGAVLQPQRARLFSYGEEWVMAAAGPLASFLLAVGSAVWGRQFGGADAYLLSGLSLALGLFNLIPARPMDGGRMLQAMLSRFLGLDVGETAVQTTTRIFGIFLTGAGVWLWRMGGNFTLLLCGIWLLFRRRSAV